MLGSVLYYLSYAHTFLDASSLNDEGFCLYGAVRVMHGQRPLVDFWSYPPGRYWLFAGVFSVFGVNVLTGRAVLAVLMALKNGLAYDIARKFMPRWAAIACVATIALIPGLWHKVFYSLLMFAQLRVLLWYLEQPGARRAMACGLAAGVSFYFRQDTAAYGLVACAILISIAMLPGKQWRQWWKQGWSVLGAFLVALVPLLIYYADSLPIVLSRLGPDPVKVAEVVYQRIDFVSPDRLARFFLVHLTAWPNYLFLRTFYPQLVIALGVVGLIAAGYRWLKFRKQQEDKYKALAWTALSVWSVLSLVKVYKQPDFAAVLMAGQGVMLIGFAVACGPWLRRHWMVAAPVWLVLALSWLSLPALMVAPVDGLDTNAWTMPPAADQRYTLETPVGTFDLPKAQGRRLNRLMKNVEMRSTPDQTIYAWQQPMLYLICRRDNATRSDNVVPPMVLEDWANHFREVFRKHPPALQILDVNPAWFKRLEAYPADLQHLMFDGYRMVADCGDHLLLKRSVNPGQFQNTLDEVRKHLEQE